MTAPACAIHITPEIVERFTDYYRRALSWGVFHVSLDDGNYCAVMPWAHASVATWTDEERELVRIHDLMTASQRRRLKAKCQQLRERQRQRWSVPQ